MWILTLSLVIMLSSYIDTTQWIIYTGVKVSFKSATIWGIADIRRLVHWGVTYFQNNTLQIFEIFMFVMPPCAPYFLSSSYINLKKTKKAKKNLRSKHISYKHIIYIQMKFCLVIHLIIAQNALLDSFPFHYFWNYPN